MLPRELPKMTKGQLAEIDLGRKLALKTVRAAEAAEAAAKAANQAKRKAEAREARDTKTLDELRATGTARGGTSRAGPRSTGRKS
jgi:ethanolamine ammonia-lyase small subunit